MDAALLRAGEPHCRMRTVPGARRGCGGRGALNGDSRFWEIVRMVTTAEGCKGISETGMHRRCGRPPLFYAYPSFFPINRESDYAAGYGVAGSEIGLAVAGGFLGAAVKRLKL